MKKILIQIFIFITVSANAQNVSIGTQIWQSINLSVSTYSDGTPIPQVTDPNQWANLTTGAWCYYNNDPTNGNVYGKLYNWYAVAGIYDAASLSNPTLRKNLAPIGYHIPTYGEWITLKNHIGGDGSGGELKETGTSHWAAPNNNATNSSGFTALPGGERHFSDGSFNSITNQGYWWCLTDYDSTEAYCYSLVNFNGLALTNSTYKSTGFSVRCIAGEALSNMNYVLSEQIKVYIDIASQSFYVSHPDMNSFGITIMDLNGKQLYSGTINKEEPLDVSGYTQGMYMVTIENTVTNKKNNYKIIKK